MRALACSIPLVPLLLAAGCDTGNLAVDGGADAASAPDLRGGPTLDPGIVSRSNKSAAEAETHVAAAPNGFVAVTYIGLFNNGGSTNGYVFSRDDGNTWEPPNALPSPNGRVASDPVLAVDAQTNFYLTWIGFRYDVQGNATDMHVYAAVAPAGTTQFGAPIEVSEVNSPSDAFDKPWIVATNDGAVLITYAKTSTGGIYSARSTDGGQNWGTVVIAEDGGFRNLVFPCLPPMGSRVYVAYHSGGGIGLRWSEDHGTTWIDANKTAVADRNEGRPAFEDPTCVAVGNEVWVSYGISSEPFTVSSSAKLDSIRIAHSSDGGATIDRRWNAEDPSAASYFLHPFLARESGGGLDIVYYAGNDEGDTMGSFRLSRSDDGGATWAPSQAVKSPIVFLGSRSSQKWLGDYIGLWWARGNLYMAYTDNTSVATHVAFHRVAAP